MERNEFHIVFENDRVVSMSSNLTDGQLFGLAFALIEKTGSTGSNELLESVIAAVTNGQKT